jgi:hypothetical protein
MNWEAIAAIGQVLGSIAGFITLNPTAVRYVDNALAHPG